MLEHNELEIPLQGLMCVAVTAASETSRVSWIHHSVKQIKMSNFADWGGGGGREQSLCFMWFFVAA